MLKKLKEFIRDELNRDWNPACCKCDFEASFGDALNKMGIDQRGCYFHLLRAVKKNMGKQGVDPTKQWKVLDKLCSCFFSGTKEEFNLNLEKMFETASNAKFRAYFEKTWIGDDNKLTCRWAMAYQGKFESHNPGRMGGVLQHEKDMLAQIKVDNTNNLSEARNSADSIVYVGASGGTCTLMEEVVLINRNLVAHGFRYVEHMKQAGNLELPINLTAMKGTAKASKAK
jgi:hypothetical protein